MALELFKFPCSLAFDTHIEKVLQEIRELPNDYIAKASPTELEQHFIDKASLDGIKLLIDDHYIESQKNIQYDVSGRFNRDTEGRRASVPGTSIEIALPFEGDVNLLQIRPSQFSLSGTRARKIDVRGDHLSLEFQFPDDSADAERLKKDINDSLSFLDKSAQQLAKDVANHNSQVPARIREAIEAKRQKALKATGAVAALGIPMKRSDAPAFAIPAKRRERPVKLPPVATGTFQSEPFLADPEYAHILSVTGSMAKVIERSPANFASLNEEAIRDHFLIQLNGHYEGQASGETFNAAGKTDILLRQDDRNVFIAECKIWTGGKKFNEAIDQLLGYLTWRDCKCAILVFNRNQDSTGVAAKMHEIMESRPEHRKTVTHSTQGDSRYVFVKESEPGREIVITTQLYDVPAK
jgi:hypothetical protein